MKKSTLLSLATVGTIVATSIGTFAAWDTLEVTKEATVTIETPVTMSMDELNLKSSRTAGVLDATNAPTYTQDVKFTVKDLPDAAEQTYQLNVTPSVTNTDGTAVAAGEVTVTATKAATDTNEDIAGDHTYTVTLTPKDNTVANKEYKVSLTAEIASKTAQ